VVQYDHARRANHEREDHSMQRKTHDIWRREATRRGLALAVAALVGLSGLAAPASAGEQSGNYLALKGGIYSPSKDFDLGNINVENTFDADTESGVAGEIAFGRFFSPSFALELGIGYFKSKGTFEDELAARRELEFNVIPVILSAKVFVPIGPVYPFGEFGVGAYFSEFEVSDSANTFSGTTTFGIHAGAGLNAFVSSRVFVGLEGRYVWNDPSFGDQAINLNGDDYSLHGFKLNGFTMLAVLGLVF
jgi:opacity protein-like surface antigen